jgi:hypothetical protein
LNNGRKYEKFEINWRKLKGERENRRNREQTVDQKNEEDQKGK